MSTGTKRFLLVREQDGGCDYTIGCGVVVDEYDAESIDALLAQLRTDMDDDADEAELRNEERVSRATVYEVVAQRELPLDAWRRELDAAAAAAPTLDTASPELMAEFKAWLETKGHKASR